MVTCYPTKPDFFFVHFQTTAQIAVFVDYCCVGFPAQIGMPFPCFGLARHGAILVVIAVDFFPKFVEVNVFAAQGKILGRGGGGGLCGPN